MIVIESSLLEFIKQSLISKDLLHRVGGLSIFIYCYIQWQIAFITVLGEKDGG